MICLDLPSVHDLSTEIRDRAINLGIHLFAFPHNTTHWSQMCDSRYCFGMFKKEYYEVIELAIIDRSMKGVANAGRIDANSIPGLVRRAWAAVTENRIVAAFLATGIIPGHNKTLKDQRLVAQQVVIANAHDATSSDPVPSEV